MATTCVECDRAVGPGTRAFTTRVVVPTKAGIDVVLCGSCADPGKPIARRWAAMETEEGLASMSTTVRPNR